MSESTRFNGSILYTIIRLLLLTISAIAVYRIDLPLVFAEGLANELTNYVLVIPFLVAYVVYRRRQALKAALAFDLENRDIRIDAVAGLTLMVAALTLYWYGSFSSYALTYRILSLPIFVLGELLTLFGKSTARALVFPLFLLLFLTPITDQLTAGLGSVLSFYTTAGSVGLVKVFGVDAVTSIQYGTPVIQFPSLAGGDIAFAVSIVCSGLYSLTGFAAFSAFAAYIPRGKILAKAGLFSLGFVLIYALNILRVTIILLIGRFYGQGTALSVFHAFGGSILIFLGTLGLLYLGEKVWRLKFSSPKPIPSACSHGRDSDSLLGGFCNACGRLARFPSKPIRMTEFALPALVIFVSVIMILAQTPLFVYAQGPNPNTFSIPLGDRAPPNLLPIVNLTQGSWTPSFMYRDFGIGNITYGSVHAAWVYAYFPSGPGTSTGPAITVTIEVSPSMTYLDYPEVSICYATGSPYHVPCVDPTTESTTILQNPYVPGELFIYTDANHPDTRNVIYSWRYNATFLDGNSYLQEFVLTGLHTTAQGLVSGGLVKDPSNSTQIEEALHPFAQSIAQYWKPVQSASVLAQYLATARQSTLPWLLLIIFGGLTFTLFGMFTEARGPREWRRIFAKLQSIEDRTLIEIILSARTGLASGEVASFLEKKGLLLPPGTVVNKLRKAEAIGLVRKKLLLGPEDIRQLWSIPVEPLIASFWRLRRGAA